MAGNVGAEFCAGWKKLDNTSKNKLLSTIQADPVFQPRVTSAEKRTADIESIEATPPNVYSNIQLYPYLSYLYYYPTIHWSLDKTPDTDDYWVGLYDKNEKDDKKYLAYQWIYKAAQGSYKVGKLGNTAYKYGSSRFEEYEVRIFRHGYQRLDAKSNVLRGIVNHLPTNPFTLDAKKLLSSRKREQPDKELESFLVGIHGDIDTGTLSSPEVALKKWSGFTPIQKHLMFPILEQDSLPDTLTKPDERGTDRPEPNVHLANRSKLGGIAECNEAPSQIVLTITLDHSCTYTYPEVDVEDEVPSEGAWLGLYRIHDMPQFDCKGYINWKHVDKGQKGLHKLSYIRDDKPGPTSNAYVGPIFDKKNQQMGLAAITIEAVISVDPPLPPAIFKPGFDKNETLRYAKLSNLAYEEYSTIQQQVVSYDLTADMRIYDAKTDTHGFIASNDESVVIVFRGTYSLDNWLTNVWFPKEPIIEGQPYLTHSGFLIAFNKVYKTIEDHIKPLIGKKKIYTTGHSLGGALASLLAFCISYKYKNAKLIHNAFACPPVGNTNLAQYFKKMHSHIINIQNDPVASGLLIRLSAEYELFQPHQVMFLPETGSHSILDYINQLENLSK